ncbi:Adenylate Kinase 9, partial [Manis pentadactyla]
MLALGVLEVHFLLVVGFVSGLASFVTLKCFPGVDTAGGVCGDCALDHVFVAFLSLLVCALSVGGCVVCRVRASFVTLKGFVPCAFCALRFLLVVVLWVWCDVDCVVLSVLYMDCCVSGVLPELLVYGSDLWCLFCASVCILLCHAVCHVFLSVLCCVFCAFEYVLELSVGGCVVCLVRGLFVTLK